MTQRWKDRCRSCGHEHEANGDGSTETIFYCTCDICGFTYARPNQDADSKPEGMIEVRAVRHDTPNGEPFRLEMTPDYHFDVCHECSTSYSLRQLLDKLQPRTRP